jgi:hypothetical protein
MDPTDDAPRWKEKRIGRRLKRLGIGGRLARRWWQAMRVIGLLRVGCREGRKF